MLVAAQILPEVGLGSAYQRLGLALENSEAVKVTYLLRAEKKSLRSTQVGANLAILACARFDNQVLFSNYMQPKLRTSMCCVPYVDPNFYIPDSKAIEDALVEILETRAYHCIDDYHFLQYDTKILCLVIKRVGVKISDELDAIEKAEGQERKNFVFSLTELSEENSRKFDSLNYLAFCMKKTCFDEETKKFAEKFGLFERPRHWWVCIDDSMKNEYTFMPIEG